MKPGQAASIIISFFSALAVRSDVRPLRSTQTGDCPVGVKGASVRRVVRATTA